jgi:TIR domain-containing protein
MSSFTPQQTTADAPASAGGWDFFLSHSHDGLLVAQHLRNEFEPPASVFFDQDDLADGRLWNDDLKKALNDTRVFVLLLSRADWDSLYVNAEKDVAVDIYKSDRRDRRVVPVYLKEKKVPTPKEAPFPLGSFQGVAVPDPDNLGDLKRALARTLREVNPEIGRRLETIVEAREGSRRVSHGGAGLVTGLWQTTSPIRPLPQILLVAWVTLTLLILVSLFSHAFGEVWMFAAIIFTVMWLAVLIILLLLVYLSFRYLPRIA